MSILNLIIETLNPTGIAVETSKFTGKAKDEYIVLTPMSDVFEAYADNTPTMQIHQVRISFFCKENYLQKKRQIERLLILSGFTITQRLYIGFEDDTKYHHIAIDVEKEYEFKEEE